MPSHIHKEQGWYSKRDSGDQQVRSREKQASSDVDSENAMLPSGGSQPHTHSLSGASGEASSLPPYYALSYIMRIA